LDWFAAVEPVASLPPPQLDSVNIALKQVQANEIAGTPEIKSWLVADPAIRPD
jgi:hypothetical protein